MDGPRIRRFSDLVSLYPADATLQNLLAVVSAKLDLASRLAVYRFEAAREGHPACADAFATLADAEGEQLAELLLVLRRHLEATEAPLSTPAPEVAS